MQPSDELLNDFLQESRDHLTSIEADLLAMEEAGAEADDQLVNKVFRAAHSIKGGAGFFSLERLQTLAHRLENALDMVRGKEMVPTPEVVNILLLGFDRLREMINQPRTIETTEIDDLVVALTGLASSHLPEGEKKTLATPVVLPASQGQPGLLEISQFDLKRAARGGKNIFILDFDLLHDAHRHGHSPWSIFKELQSCGKILDCAWDLDAVGTLDDEPTNVIPFQVLYCTPLDASLISSLMNIPAERITPVPTESLEPAPAKAPEKAPAKAPARTPEAAPRPPAAAPRTPEQAPAEAASGDTTLRVSVAVLEQLMNLAGEMVLGRNQLLEAISRQDSQAIQAGAQRINLVTSELQEAIMLTRMQPVGNILGRFPRVVRDLSRELGKEIQLTISGKDVELDRSILEGLTDPLTHMVRNAVDHGIELPAARREAGKHEAGTVDIRVFHQAGQVVVEIQDDGKGLDVALITAKAVEKGLITPEQARSMNLKEQTALIFLPGLSTADKVSNLSGRGVGMDVVRTNIQKLGGTIDIETEKGSGSVFRIKLPLTLAIVPSLLVSDGGDRFALPQVNVAELTCLEPDQVRERVEVVGETEVLLLRGELIPLVRLADVLGMHPTYEDPATRARVLSRRRRLSDRRGRAPDAGAGLPRGRDRRVNEASQLNVVIVNAGTFRYGIVVEAFHDTVEIVVKPLGRHLKAFREYAGATILGDGGVALIVDVVSLAGLLGLTSQGGTDRARELEAQMDLDRFKDRHAFLTFHNAPDEPCIVPLEQVARVERVERGQIERIGGRCTMQYRGGSLALASLGEAAGLGEFTPDQELAVIVFALEGREAGLLAALPVDSVEVEEAVDLQTLRRPGIAGSMIIHGRTTLIVDIHEVVLRSFGEEQAMARKPVTGGARTILLAEDSDFFRNQMKTFLESDGYTVIPAADGRIAWDLLQQHGDRIHALVSDIEMPNMNGFELVRKIRSSPSYAGLPAIAVTSLAGEDDAQEGRAAGFQDYQLKLDKERLLEGLRTLLSSLTPNPPQP